MAVRHHTAHTELLNQYSFNTASLLGFTKFYLMICIQEIFRRNYENLNIHAASNNKLYKDKALLHHLMTV